MSLLKKIVKATVLAPRRIIEGVVEGVDETINGPPAPKKRK